MTLVLSLLTSNYVVQVSDRRLTNPDTGETLEDDVNKAVVFCGRVAFSYTGLARIESKATEIWLAEQIVSCASPALAFEALRNSGTRAWSLQRRLWRHEFMAAGWGRSAAGAALEPFLATVSNHDKATGTSRTFRGPFIDVLGSEPFRLASIGQLVPERIKRRTQRTVGEVVRRNSSPYVAAHALSYAIWEVAAVNDTVGENLMVCIVPRAAAEQGTAEMIIPIRATGLDPDAVQGFRVGTPHMKWSIQGPTFVCGGMIMARPVIATGPDAEFATLDEIADIRRSLGLPRFGMT
jgi:hypothetical protein